MIFLVMKFFFSENYFIKGLFYYKFFFEKIQIFDKSPQLLAT